MLLVNVSKMKMVGPNTNVKVRMKMINQRLMSLRTLIPFSRPEYTLNPKIAPQMTTTTTSIAKERSKPNSSASPADSIGVPRPIEVPTPPIRPNMNSTSIILPGIPEAARSPITPAQAADRRKTGRLRFQ